MATLHDVARFATALPDVTEGERHGNKTWFVGKKAFVWERPLTKADLKRFGDETPPDGEIIALRTEDLHDKEAILAVDEAGFFTMAHFDNYPAFLIQLKAASKTAVREAIIDAWLATAPAALGDAYLAKKRRR